MKTINLNLRKIGLLGLSLILCGYACVFLQKICTKHEYLEQTKSELLTSFIFTSVIFIGCVIFTTAIIFEIKAKIKPKLSDLSMIPQQDKNKIIKDFSEITSRHTLELFMMLGLKNHIECMIVNDYNGEEFIFSFKKVAKKEQFNENCKLLEQDRLIINLQEEISELKAKANILEKPVYYIWDGVNTDMTKVASLDEAKEIILNDYVEDGDVHPDIESIFVVQKIMSTRYSDRLKTVYFEEHK